MAPVLERIEKEREDTTFVKVDAFTETSLAAKFGIGHVPTFILFEAGLEAKRYIGPLPSNALRDWLE